MPSRCHDPDGQQCTRGKGDYMTLYKKYVMNEAEARMYGRVKDGNHLTAEHTFPRFSKAEMDRRLANIRKLMKKRDLDCLIVAGSSARWNEKNANIRYYTEWGDLESTINYLLIPMEGELSQFIWMKARELNAHLASSIMDIHGVHPYELEAMIEQIKELGLAESRIGIEGIDKFVFIPHNHYRILEESLPKAHLSDESGMTESLRAVKSDEEIAFMGKACELVDRACYDIAENLKPGMRDYEVFAIVNHAILSGGGEAPLLNLVASTSMNNPLLPFPNIHPSGRIINQGDIVLTELSGKYGGYWGQVQKPFALGKPTELYEHLTKVNKELYHIIVEELYPGNKLGNLSDAANKYLEKVNVGKVVCFAHGLGMEAPEEPLIDEFIWPMDLEQVFVPGNCFAVEPNPSVDEKYAGLFIGDTWVVTETGSKCLNRFPADLTIV